MRFPKTVALVAGLISATGFAPLELWAVTIAAFALWIWIVAQAPDLRVALARGWWFGLGHFLVGMNWIAGAFRYQDAMPIWLGYIAVVVLALYLAVFPAVAAGLAWRWGRASKTVYVLLFAAAWVVTEYLRASLFTGFAWNPLGVVLVPTPADGLAKLIGTYGVSGCLILVAGALVHAKRIIAFPVTLGALMLTGWLTIYAAGDRGRTDTIVRVIQPNIGLKEGRDISVARPNLEKLAQLTGPPTADVRLIFWPEAALNDGYEIDYDARLRADLASLLGPDDLLITGGTRIEYARRQSGAGVEEMAVSATNSVFVLAADAEIDARYDKAHLVPYGEYLPMRAFMSAIGLSRLVPGDIDYKPGPGPRSIVLPRYGTLGVQICYEIIFSGEVADRRNRPAFLFNPSNDAWFGSWGPPEHLAQARLRAIEEGLPVIRSTPTGISAVIDPNGELLVALPMNKAGFIQIKLPAPAAPTLFSRFGNILPLGFALTLTGFAVALRRRRR